MGHKVFINLPVKDVKRSRSFFAALGYSFNEKFSDDQSFAMPISNECVVMMLAHEKFTQFTQKTIVDAHKSTEVLVALALETRDQVDEMMVKVLANGGAEARPVKDHGFMYEHAYQDLDGHVWELFWMDPKVLEEGAAT